MFSPTRLNIHHLLNFIFRRSKGAKQCKLLGPPEIVPATHQSLSIYLFIYLFMNLQTTNVLILILRWNPVNTVTNTEPMKNLPC